MLILAALGAIKYLGQQYLQEKFRAIFINSEPGNNLGGEYLFRHTGYHHPIGHDECEPATRRQSDGYFGLASNSPAIDASSTNYPAILDIANVDDDPSLLLDISGQARPALKALKDVGCDEFGSEWHTNRPLSLSDVGPLTWAARAERRRHRSGRSRQNQTVDVGAPVSFFVVASGTAPLSYQWRKNGANLVGATAATNSIVSAQTNDAGSYAVVVTNVAGSVTSAVATLTINVPPSSRRSRRTKRSTPARRLPS